MSSPADALFELTDLAPPEPAPVYAVHCFFNCPHVVREGDPDTASKAMEQHYDDTHTADIDRALGFLGVQPSARRKNRPAA
ncbi:hypothetical protein ELQ39_15830 [Streptomyces sp. GB4-14]|uniref:hypothetical protein n=1 Tax=Streptomyces sp. GB4-14 TaxID=2498703 RepID=UPI001F5FAB65|nr:hypothetical protein [Streptomyces sp. GB4-14]